MISASAQPIYIYPDQLITDTWPGWVETILSKLPDEEHRGSRGFQVLAEGENSSIRTRAGEAYRLGLLLQRVIREREGPASVPKGWEYVCNGKTVLSKIGYLSYAVGKALSVHADNADINRALNVLFLIFSLSIGTSTGGKSVSTALVYRRVFQCFREDVGATAFDPLSEEYSRLIAAAVFNTLDNPIARPKLLSEYINSDHFYELLLEREADNSEHAVTVATLSAKLSGKHSAIPDINDIPRKKAPLFWASPDRGMFTKGAKVGLNLLDAIIPLDRAALSNTGNSILYPALIVDADKEHLLLESLTNILAGLPSTSKIWRDLMEQLSQGVYAALAYLEDTTQDSPKSKLFHLHDVAEFTEGVTPLTVELNKSKIPVIPEVNSTVLVRKTAYRVTNINVQSDAVNVTLELGASQTVAPLL